MQGLFYIKVSAEEARITGVHYAPQTLTEREKSINYLEVEFIPEPTITAGKDAVLYVNLESKELYYMYVDTPSDPADEIASLWANQESTNQSIAELSILMSSLLIPTT